MAQTFEGKYYWRLLPLSSAPHMRTNPLRAEVNRKAKQNSAFAPACAGNTCRELVLKNDSLSCRKLPGTIFTLTYLLIPKHLRNATKHLKDPEKDMQLTIKQYVW